MTGDAMRSLSPASLLRRHGTALRAVLLLVAVALAIKGQDLLDGRTDTQVALALYLFALTAATLAFAGWRPSSATPGLSRWQEATAVALILAIALALRLLRWDSVPPGVVTDEAANGLEAAQIAETNEHHLWSDALSGRPTLYLEVVAGFFKILGAEVFVLRFVSMLTGVAVVFFVYLLAREAFGVRTALVAAYLMAVMRWANHYSRLALEAVMAPLFILASAYFLLRALRTRSLWSYAAAGAALSLGLYTYISFRLVPLIFAAFLFLALVQGRWAFLRKHWLGLATFGAVSLAVFAPLGHFALNNSDRFGGRFGEVSVFERIDEVSSYDPLLGNIARHLQMFNYKGPPFPGMNWPEASMLSPPLAVLFALGISLVVLRWRRPAYYLIPIWFAAGLTAGIVTIPEETPHSTRTIIVMPLVAIVAALFLHEAVSLGGQALRRYRYVVTLSAVGVLILIGVVENDIYFNKYAHDPRVWNAFRSHATTLAQFIERESADHDVYMAPAFYNFPTKGIVRFVAYDARGKHRPLNYTEDVPARSSRRDVLYILEYQQRLLLPLLRNVYPSGVFREHKTPSGGIMYLTYSVSKEEIEDAYGLSARFYANEAWQGAPAVERRDAVLDLSATGLPLPPPYSAEWSGSIYIPRYDRYRLRLLGDGAGVVLVDGAPFPANGRPLEKGLHSLHVRYRSGGGELPALVWERAGLTQVVAPWHLFAFETDLNGLQATYWQNNEFEGVPVFTQIDPVVYANNIVPGAHSIEWNGWLWVEQPGDYTLATISDEGSFVYIDGRLVVDNGGKHGAQRKDRTRNLSRGFHPIRVLYFETHGGRLLELRWAPPQGEETIIPREALYYRLPAVPPP